ncbi:MAG: type II secretion system F family protein [Coriobacteriia bacterium]|nr:type II secretion system F family protein [Coriobacteriia bacterium]MCL2745554.1 type II secretion system F family protein [Coriobacteriia bacterium]MCL2870430.1 type II secretion system F family protein [Coriobacteriia bacterium]
MYDAVTVQAVFHGSLLILALGTILFVALFAALLASLVMRQAKSSRRRTIQNRLQGLKGFSAVTDRPTHKDEAENMLDEMGNTLVALLVRASRLPVIRIVILPLISKIEQQKSQKLKDSCMHDLPEMVDILSLALGAGLSIDQAFEWYLSSYDTPLAGEFRRAEQAYQAGMLSRMKAFEGLAESLQEEAVLRFVNALRQAFTLGSALGPALHVLSQDVRKYRVVRIEERIAKTPVKILAPLGLCIVPAVLILLMGPIMSQVLQGLQL